MTHILLTGAGFSRNWGGVLAHEVFQRLIGDGTSEALRNLLWRARSTGQNFEDVLAALQGATDDQGKALCAELISLLVGIFNGMGQAFTQMQFEFAAQPSVQRSLRTFLTRFDMVFTLNQDTLMEQKYLPTVMDQRWAGAAVPGMKFTNPGAFQGSVLDRIAPMEPNPGEFKFHPTIQSYVKLHGSANWVESNAGGRILVMGGAKAITIGKFPILAWYHEEFKKALLRPGAKLMVMGYSFSDTHINEAIMEGIIRNKLKVFIVDPAGESILDKRDPRAMIPAPETELMLTIRPAICGLSIRPLTSTFNDDVYEHDNLSNFFK